jgi:hypothetical protein
LTKVGIVLDLFDRLIGAFVALVPVRYGKLGPFLEVDDERDGDARAARPSDFRQAAAMAAEIAFGNACHVGSPVAKAGAMPSAQMTGAVESGPQAAQDFLLGGGTLWPPAASDFLYSETEFFVLSDFGFLASLLLRI